MLPESKAQESLKNSLPTSSVVSTSVPVHEVTQLGLRSHPTGYWQYWSFFTSGVPIRPFQVNFTIFTEPLTGVGRPYGRFPDLRYLHPFRPQAPYQLFGTQSGNFPYTPMGYSASGPPGHEYLVAGNDSFSFPVTSSSGHFSVATISGHSPHGQAHSRLSERASRPPVSAKSATNDRVDSPSQDHNSNLRDLGIPNSGHVCHRPKGPSPPMSSIREP